MRTGADIKGLKEFEYALTRLGKDGEKMAYAALRKASRPMLMEYRRRAATISQTLSKSVGYLRGKRAPGQPKIGIGIRINKFPDAWFAHVTEYGAKGIKIKKSWGGKKAFADLNKDFLWVGKLKKGTRYRKDMKARPFARPAVDATKEIVKKNLGPEMAREMKKRLR